MSSSSSSSSSSGSETEEIFNVEGVELSSIVPYEGDLEPLATAEEAAEQEARMAEELEEERRFQARFTREVDASTWYENLAGFYKYSLSTFTLPFTFSVDH